MFKKIWKYVKKAAAAIFVLNREDIIDVNEAPVIKGTVDHIDQVVPKE